MFQTSVSGTTSLWLRGKLADRARDCCILRVGAPALVSPRLLGGRTGREPLRLHLAGDGTGMNLEGSQEESQ